MLPKTPEKSWRRWNSFPRPVNEVSTPRWHLRKLELSVTTVDYYARNADFQISLLKPQQLNKFGEEVSRSPLTTLSLPINTGPVLPDEKIENHMESLLNYLRERPEALEDVDFVTYRQILAKAAIRQEMGVQAIRCHGRIWIRKGDDNMGHDPGSVHLHSMARANAFVGELVEQDDGCLRRNGLFTASISPGYGRILYPGEMDAIDHTGANVEIKSTLRDDWVYRRGEYAFWQCHLGNVDKIILGRIDEDTVRSVAVFSKEQLFGMVVDKFRWFSVEKGVGRIEEMLRVLRRHLTADGDEVVLERKPWQTGGGSDWMVVEERRVSETFRRMVQEVFVLKEEQ